MMASGSRGAGCIGDKACGLQLDVRLPEPLYSATFSYWFHFSANYSWTSGGKLPGVCAEGAHARRLEPPACLRFCKDLLRCAGGCSGERQHLLHSQCQC